MNIKIEKIQNVQKLVLYIIHLFYCVSFPSYSIHSIVILDPLSILKFLLVWVACLVISVGHPP